MGVPVQREGPCRSSGCIPPQLSPRALSLSSDSCTCVYVWYSHRTCGPQIFVARRDNARAIFRQFLEARGGALPADRWEREGESERARGRGRDRHGAVRKRGAGWDSGLGERVWIACCKDGRQSGGSACTARYHCFITKRQVC